VKIKITESQLKQIIKEEAEAEIREMIGEYRIAQIVPGSSAYKMRKALQSGEYEPDEEEKKAADDERQLELPLDQTLPKSGDQLELPLDQSELPTSDTASKRFAPPTTQPGQSFHPGKWWIVNKSGEKIWAQDMPGLMKKAVKSGIELKGSKVWNPTLRRDHSSSTTNWGPIERVPALRAVMTALSIKPRSSWSKYVPSVQPPKGAGKAPDQGYLKGEEGWGAISPSRLPELKKIIYHEMIREAIREAIFKNIRENKK